MDLTHLENLFGAEIVHVLGYNFVHKNLRIEINENEAFQKILDFVVYKCDKLKTNLLSIDFWENVLDGLNSTFIIENNRFEVFFDLYYIIDSFFSKIYPELSNYDITQDESIKLIDAVSNTNKEDFTHASDFTKYLWKKISLKHDCDNLADKDQTDLTTSLIDDLILKTEEPNLIETPLDLESSKMLSISTDVEMMNENIDSTDNLEVSNCVQKSISTDVEMMNESIDSTDNLEVSNCVQKSSEKSQVIEDELINSPAVDSIQKIKSNHFNDVISTNQLMEENSTQTSENSDISEQLNNESTSFMYSPPKLRTRSKRQFKSKDNEIDSLNDTDHMFEELFKSIKSPNPIKNDGTNKRKKIKLHITNLNEQFNISDIESNDDSLNEIQNEQSIQMRCKFDQFYSKDSRKDTMYTQAEDKKIIEYIINNNSFRDIKGNELYKNMEKYFNKKRSWQSLKNRFLRTILPNFSLIADLLNIKIDHREIFENANWKNTSISPTKSCPYTKQDDEELLICVQSDDLKLLPINGNKIWQEVEKRFKFRNERSRTWQSLKERFTKRIVPTIYNYNSIDLEMAEKFVKEIRDPQVRQNTLRKLREKFNSK
ncbi:hypothetical protein BLOT_004081 [Blomia tropicalis]|nr:hypothetical protein BLOT_004081 [Blomia tropicalis]